MNSNGISEFKLPNGPIDDSFKISLFVNIVDDSNAVYKYSILNPLIVQPNVALIDNLANKILLNNSDYLNELRNSSVQYTTSFITSFASILDNQNSATNKVLYKSFKFNVNS